MNSINKKRTHRFNAIDLIIIVAIIITVVFISKTATSDLLNNNITNIEYTIRVSGVSNDNISKINVSDKLRINNGNDYIGTIKEITISPSVSYVFNYETDRFVPVENNDKYDIYLLLDANCKIENNRFIINGNTISANKEIQPVLSFEYTDAIIIKAEAINVNTHATERSAETIEE